MFIIILMNPLPLWGFSIIFAVDIFQGNFTMSNNNLNWTVAYNTVFGEKKVESFKDKKEATARYEALLARTYGSLGDIAGVTKPVQSGAKVMESKEQKTQKKCESWVVDYKRLFDSEIESEEFDNLTDANEFYNRLMDDAEGYEFIDEPREVEGLEECGGSSAASLGAIPTGVVRQNDESKKNEDLTDKEEHEWYRFWFDDVKKHIVPGKSGSVEHNCKMLPYSDVRQMWGVAAMAKELCDNFRRYLSYRGYTNSKGSPFAEISWRAEDTGDLLTAMNKADGTSIESKKSEATGDAGIATQMISALRKKAEEDREWFGKFNEMYANELEEVGLSGITMVFRPKDPYQVDDRFQYNVEWQPYDANYDYVKNEEFDKKTYGFIDSEWDGKSVVTHDYRPLDEQSINDFYDIVVGSGAGDEGIFLWVLDQYKQSLGKTESKKFESAEMTEEAVTALLDELNLVVDKKWFDGNKTIPVFDCRDVLDEGGELVSVRIEPPYEARVWFTDRNPRNNSYTEGIETIEELRATLKKFFDMETSESKKSEADGEEAKLQAAYGDGGIITHESSADGFYVNDHDPMGYAILNNDVATMKELFAGTASVPEKPWTYAGWHEDIDAPEDKDGNYPYVYDWERENDTNFVNDWKRVVGETNNEEALNLLLEKAPDFVPTAIDFYNAFHAGYDKKLLRKLLDNISTVVDKEDISSEYLNYEEFGEDAYDNLDKFLDASESCKSEALPPKQWGDRARKFPSRAALVNKAKTLGATEITSHDDYKKLNDDVFLDKIGFAMDINGNCKARLWWGENDGKYYYSITRDVLDKSGW